MPMNYAKTGLLLAVMTAIFVAMGAVVGGKSGMLIAFLLALAMNAFALWNSGSMVLKMYRAQEVDARTAPELHDMVRVLAERAELPMPRVYIMNNAQPNAFATGRSPSNSAVCVSTGLMEMLTREELAGVVAHELAHIKNRDTLTMTVAATIGGAISMMAQYLQFGMLFGGGNRDNNGGGLGFLGSLIAILVAPMAATLVQMAISRSREYQADRMGAMIVGNPIWLANALKKIQGYVKRIPNPMAESVPSTAHLFILNPLSGRGVDNWFSTHPNTENRIAELEALAREMGQLDSGSTGAYAEQQAPHMPRQGGPSTSVPETGGRNGPWG
jgi:heat shock protein HtpX